jgi:clan AA aspartic protease
MGFVYADITLSNALDVGNCKRGSIKESEIRQTAVRALVDTGAGTLVINEAIRQQLGLEIDEGNVHYAELADGSTVIYSRSEPVQIQWKNRKATFHAAVVPSANEVLLGTLPLEDMDLIVHPSKLELIGAHGDEIVLRI